MQYAQGIRLFSVVLVLLCSPVFAQDSEKTPLRSGAIGISLAADTGSLLMDNLGPDDGSDITTGFALNLEYLHSVSRSVRLGVGGSLFFHQSLAASLNDDILSAGIASSGIAGYGIFELWVNLLDKGVRNERRRPKLDLFFKGLAGYAMPSLWFEDPWDWEPPEDLRTTGGLYFGIGAGMIFRDSVFAQILYKTYSGNIHWPDQKEGFSMHFISFEFGYRFTFG